MTPTIKDQLQTKANPDDLELKNILISAIMGLSQEKQDELWKELQDCGIIKKEYPDRFRWRHDLRYAERRTHQRGSH